jgi:hypothetical protein
VIVWSNEQIEQWRLRQKWYLEDKTAVISGKEIDQRRTHAQQEMIELLSSFLDGVFSLREFNRVFQLKTRAAWSGFHVGGMSGGMFLNKLVKYTPNEATFAHLLRLMIRAPEDVRDGQRQMQAFVRFLEGLIASQQVQRAQLQPARVPFFLSAWWHVQAPEQWPLFYLSLRRVLMTTDGTVPTMQDPVAYYFAYQERFLSLKVALGLSSWELEHLLVWDEQQSLEGNAARPQTDTKVDSRRRHASNVEGKGGSHQRGLPLTEQHTHIQWVLAKLGQKVGCRVWITADAHHKLWKQERLGDLSLASLPVVSDPVFKQSIDHIDVLWLLKNEIIAAYTVPWGITDISTRLLGLYDLKALLPKREVYLCLVTPRERFEQVRRELSRPVFHGYRLQKQCGLIAEELLLEQEAHILRWANSPAVITELIGSHDSASQQ